MKYSLVTLFLLSVIAYASAQDTGLSYEEDMRLRDERLPPDYLVPGTEYEEDDGHDQYLEEKSLMEEWLESNPLVITKDGFVMPVQEAEAAGIYSGDYEFLDSPPETQYYEHGGSE